MSEQVRALVGRVAQRIKELSIEAGKAYWEMSTTGKSEAAERAADLEKELRLFTSDRDVFAQLKAAKEHPTGDAALDRQVEGLYSTYLENQLSPEIIAEQVRRSTELQQIFGNFRGKVGDRSLSDNEIKSILAKSTDSAERKAAWMASKQVGVEIAPRLVELVKLRNEGARSLGFRNYYEMALELTEIKPADLFALLGELKALTDGPFAAMKQELDAEQAERFGISPAEMMPWHYADPFFQEAPASKGADIDHYFEGKSIEQISMDFFSGVGMDVRDIIDRSDLYEREGKNQHAFCTDIDREGDIRVLCNLRPNAWWMSTMLHELGHGVYDKYVDRSLPWLLRSYAHISSTEAIAMYFGRLTKDADWLIRYAGMPEGEARQAAGALQQELTRSMLIFVRWVLVMAHFESRMYENPDQDLNRLWWNIVGEMQLLKTPAALNGCEWATKIHFSMAPVYYHNYLIGEVTASHLQAHIAKATGTAKIVENRGVGQWLIERFFKPGSLYPWNRLVEHATGEALSPKYFVEQFVHS